MVRMKNCLRKLAPVFNTNRMVKEYAEKFYVPAGTRGGLLAADGLARARSLSVAKAMYLQKWGGIRVVGVNTSGNGHYKVGQDVQVETTVDLPDLDPKELRVQLYAGEINSTGEIESPQVVPMTHSKAMGGSRHMFVGALACRSSGRQGFAIRVLPGNPDLATPFESGLIYWN
jgi:starch phosphorylase